MNFKSCAFTLVFSITSCLPCFAYNSSKLPNLGHLSSTPFHMEADIGKQYMHMVYSRLSLIYDPILVDYINQLGDNLASYSDTFNQPLHFFIVNDETINAFAGPGGYIGVNKGLILASKNESELAGVLAHEIAHVTAGHFARNMERAKSMQWPTVGAMLGAILLGAYGGGTAGASGAVTATIASKAQYQINFTRNLEREADRIAVTLMNRAGYDGQGLSNFFSRMQRINLIHESKLTSFLSNHPVSTARIADANYRIKHAANLKKDTLDYRLAKERLRVMTDHSTRHLLDFYQAKLKDLPNNTTLHFGYALALTRANQYKKSIQLLSSLVIQNKYQSMLSLSLGETLQKANQDKKAICILKNSYENNPEYYPAIMIYVRSLLAANQADRALKIIRQYKNDYSHYISFLSLLAKTQGKAGRLLNAYETHAQLYIKLGRYKAAITQYEEALKYTKKTPQIAKKIRNAISALKKGKH